ncbi:MAG TPA: ABC transporter transmembrane domain-containing protein, partial [Solirubrobacterales bacterium]|nr:ABC transporter transmembrane domain-containing protein [Solirubrobacterales bacterium]
MTNFWRLLGFLRPYRNGVFATIGLAAASMAMTALIPVFAGRTVSEIQAGDRHQVQMLALTIVAAGALRALLSVGRRIISGRVSLGVEHDLRRRVYEHLNALEISFFHDQQTGQLMSRATVDLQVVRFFLGYGLAFLVQSAFTIVIAGIVMLTLQADLALMVLATIPFTVFTAARYGRLARPAQQEVQQRLAELSADVEENISGIRVIKAFAREKLRSEHFRGSVQRVFDQQLYSTRLRSYYNPLIALVPSMG